jgi:hypothetical protein
MFKIGDKVRFSEQFFKDEPFFVKAHLLTRDFRTVIIKGNNDLVHVQHYDPRYPKTTGSFYPHHLEKYNKPTVLL